MKHRRCDRFSLLPIALALVAATPGLARAAVYHYVDWMTADVAHGTAAGVITLPDGSKVTVGFAALNADGSPGNLYGAQVDGTGTNYWIPSAPYISAQVDNAPPDTDILQLAGGQNQRYVVTLSEPIKDPIMAIVSLGAPGTPTTYDFDSPFTIVSQGTGFFGGDSTSLVELPGNILQGTEGHGTIQFIGTFATFSWTVPTPEVWHGFTFGIRTTERIEPSDLSGLHDAGGLDARAIDATVDTAATPDTATSTPGSGAAASGCGCRAGGAAGNTRAPSVLSLIALVLLGARRSRRRR